MTCRDPRGRRPRRSGSTASFWCWAQIVDLRPRLGQIETNPQFAQIVPPREMVVLVTLEAKAAGGDDMAASFQKALQPLSEQVGSASQAIEKKMKEISNRQEVDTSGCRRTSCMTA